MTNYEKIKSMSITEMADFLSDERPYCTLAKSDCIYGWHENDCAAHAEQWLESEAEE